MEDRSKGLTLVYSSVALFGVIGLFGKWIALPASVLIAGRMALAALSLLAVMLVRSMKILPENKREWGVLIALGVILAAHWSLYFKSVQLTSVAIGSLLLGTVPVFVSVLEPLMFKERFLWRNLGLSLLCLAGIAVLLVPFDFSGNLLPGVACGIVSSLGFAVLSILNRHSVKRISAVALLFWQCAIGAVVLAPAFWIVPFTPRMHDFLLLAILAFGFTALPHGLFVAGMRHVSAHTATVITMLEPPYAIILAWLLLGEEIGWKTVVGGALILSSAFLVSGGGTFTLFSRRRAAVKT